MPLSPGSKLGPYEIVSTIGAGGMGEVYKARDVRLDRTVAIKTVHKRFNERFEREARAVAALNHPNICQLYDVGPDYLVMEYVEGAPIAPVDSPRKLLDIAVQMSDGLAAAHAAGIVHRDLKPDNILITREGKIKILDFGLAKAAHEEIGAEEATRTVAVNLTDPGTTLGTIAYMSPEQARGEANLTPQSDQFSLGLVLYELAAGKKAFPRGSTAEIMVAIIREDAEPLPASVSPQFRWIVERLLAKEPAERYDSTRDLYRELRQVRDRLTEQTSAVAIPAVSAAKKRRLLPGAALIAVGLALGIGLAALLIKPAPAGLEGYKFTPIAREEAIKWYPRWSPDGKSIAYSAIIHGVQQVFTKAVGSRDTTQLTHAGDRSSNSIPSFWSPDSATVYYSSKGSLWAIGVAGGTPELVMEKATDVALHPDGKTVAFNRENKTWTGELKGGVPKELPLPQIPHAYPIAFSPDGSRLLLFDDRGLFWILPWPSGTARSLGKLSGLDVAWLPDSRHVLMTRGGEAYGLSLLDVTDGSSRVVYAAPEVMMNISVSPNGKKIAFSGGKAEWNVIEATLPEGRVHTVVGGGEISMQPEWAPSGTHFLFAAAGSSKKTVIEDQSAADGFSRQVAEAPEGLMGAGVIVPRWDPDGKRFLFRQFAPTSRLMMSNGTGGGSTTIADIPYLQGFAWSPDGQWIALSRKEGGKQQLVKMKPAAGAAAIPLTNAVPLSPGPGALPGMVQWSPAGDWIVYPSEEGISMVSPDGSTVRKLTARKLSVFAFSKDGAQVYGIVRNTTGEGAEWQLYSIDVKTGADKMLAPIDLPASTAGISGFSLHPDGKRFLTSISKYNYDLWMLEGWDQPQKTWLDRLLRR
jgi:Tol biopolymer transport system component/tRNA A-37 threonylcarbamoyl transferase component Bud32